MKFISRGPSRLIGHIPVKRFYPVITRFDPHSNLLWVVALRLHGHTQNRIGFIHSDVDRPHANPLDSCQEDFPKR